MSLSKDLIQQLEACATKLSAQAELLQHKIKQKCDKNRHYAEVIAEVPPFTSLFYFHTTGFLHVSIVVYRVSFKPTPAYMLPALQVDEITKVAKDRVELAKALIRASDRSAKPNKKNKGAETTEGSQKDTKNNGEAGA